MNMSAHELVRLLNELFGRFDRLAEVSITFLWFFEVSASNRTSSFKIIDQTPHYILKFT